MTSEHLKKFRQYFWSRNSVCNAGTNLNTAREIKRKQLLTWKSKQLLSFWLCTVSQRISRNTYSISIHATHVSTAPQKRLSYLSSPKNESWRLPRVGLRLDQSLKKENIIFWWVLRHRSRTRRTSKKQPAQDCSSVRQTQTAETAYFSIEQLLLFVFASRTAVLQIGLSLAWGTSWVDLVCFRRSGSAQDFTAMQRQIAAVTVVHLLWSPLDTRRCCDVESTSLTLTRRRNNVVCPEWSSCWCFYLYIAGLHDITACQSSPVLISG